MKILANLAGLFILVFVYLEPIYGFFETSGDSLGSSTDWLILPSLVKNKLTHANSLIINGYIDGKDNRQVNISDYVKTPEKILDLPVLDPLSLSSMWLLTNEVSDFINATLNRVSVTGLRNFKVKDVASNDLTKGLSILLQFPGLKVTGDYEISHHAHQPFLPAQFTGRVSNDSGSFSIKIPNWYTSWFANVINYNLTNSTLTIVNPWCKSYHDTVIPQFTSNSTSYQCDSLCYKAFNSIASMIVNRVTSEIDSHLLKLMSLLIKEEKPIDWVHQYTLALSHHHFNHDRRLSSSSNNDIVNHMEESHSRSKRQVPCKPGKELDEYVDSLFRFAARIIRVMEPFSTPNATIYLPEYNIKVFLYEGGATRAYSLQRRKSAWVHCSNESVSLGLTVGFENLRIRYKYRAIHDWKLLWDGDFEADLQDTKMQVQFTQTTPKGEEDSQVQQRVDRLRIWRLGKVRLIIRGLGNLTQGVGLWLSQYLNDPYNQKHLNPTLRRLEVEAVSMINVMLKNFTVPFFTII